MRIPTPESLFQRIGITQQLGLLGIGCDTARDGQEGLDMWRNADYAVVLADMHMPVTDGYAMTAAIRAEEASGGLARTPIVAVTANAMAGEADRCLVAGMDGFLAKPVTIARLRGTLAPWLALQAAPARMATPPPASPGVDQAMLADWLGDEPEAIASLLRQLLVSARESRVEIDSAMRDAALPRVASAAHRRRGAALAVGARPLAELAAELETTAKAGDHAGCARALASLAPTMRAVEADL